MSVFEWTVIAIFVTLVIAGYIFLEKRIAGYNIFLEKCFGACLPAPVGQGSKMYVVVESGGQWEDEWTMNIVCSADRSRATSFMAERQVKQARFDDLWKNLSDLINRWRADNPAPEGEAERALPRWTTDTEVTPEMRAELKRISSENAEIFTRNSALADQHEEKLSIVCDEFIRSKGFPEGNDLNYTVGITYRIDEVEVLPIVGRGIKESEK